MTVFSIYNFDIVANPKDSWETEIADYLNYTQKLEETLELTIWTAVVEVQHH